MNPDMAYDCGKPRGWIKKVGWKGGEKKWSCAYQAVRNFKVSNQEIGEMIGEVDLEGKDVDQVVEAWISKNKDRWKKWTECS
jgi:glycine betaine/proline transport system substrate-binding protein